MTKRIQKSLFLCLSALLFVCLAVCIGAFSAPRTAQAAANVWLWDESWTLKDNVTPEGNIIKITGNTTVDLNGLTIKRGNSQRSIGVNADAGAQPLITVYGNVTIKNGTINGGYAVRYSDTTDGVSIMTTGASDATGYVYAPLISVQPEGSLTLDNVVVTGSVNGNGGTPAANQYGGGIVNEGTLIVKNNSEIANCWSDTPGGGIYNKGILRLQGSSVKRCGSAKEGGGIYNASGAAAYLEAATNGLGSSVSYNSTIYEYDTSKGGGIYNGGSLSLGAGTQIRRNAAYQAGGGIYSHSDSALTQILGSAASPVKITYNVLTGYIRVDPSTINTESVQGGGLYSAGDKTTIDFCDVTKNKIRGESGCYSMYGAGLYLRVAAKAGLKGIVNITDNTGGPCVTGGGAVVYSTAVAAEFDKVNISANSAQEGGGIYVFGKLSVTNNTSFSGNTKNVNYKAANLGVNARATLVLKGYPAINHNERSDNGIVLFYNYSLGSAAGQTWEQMFEEIGKVEVAGKLVRGAKPSLALSTVCSGSNPEYFSGTVVTGVDKAGADWKTLFEAVDYNRELFFFEDNTLGLHKPVTVTYTPGFSADVSPQSDYTQVFPYNVAYAPIQSCYSRTGYRQSSWVNTEDAAGSYALAGNWTLTEDMSVRPVWTANKYTLTLDSNGGSQNSSKAIAYNHSVTLSGDDIPVWDGSHTFLGWAWDRTTTIPDFKYTNGAFSPSSFTYAYAQNKTLYAVWQIYTVEYIFTNVEGLTLYVDFDGSEQIFDGTSDEFIVSLTTTEAASYGMPYPGADGKAGYTFSHWEYRSRQLDPDGRLDSQEIQSGNRYYIEAVFTPNEYTVSFDFGKAGEINYDNILSAGTWNVTAEYGKDYELPSLFDLAGSDRKLYHTLNWWSDPDGNQHSPRTSVTYRWADNVTFTAVWQDIPFAIVPDMSAYPAATVTGAESLAALSLGSGIDLRGTTASLAGYTFGGWEFVRGSGTTFSILMVDSTAYTNLIYTPVTSGTQTVSVYPVFTANTNTPYKVEAWVETAHGLYTYVKDYDISKNGTTDTVTNAAAFAAEQLALIADSSHYSLVRTENVNIDGSGNAAAKNYYARNHYAYIFDADGGTFPDGSTEYTIYERWGANIYGKFPSGNIPVRAGYQYNGWFTEQNGAGEQITSFTTPMPMPAGGKTVYAYWTVKTVTQLKLPATGFGYYDTQTYYVGEAKKDFAVTVVYDDGSEDVLSSLDTAFTWQVQSIPYLSDFDTSEPRERIGVRLGFKTLQGNSIYTPNFYYEVLPKENQADLTMSQTTFTYSEGLLPLDFTMLVGGGSGEGEFTYYAEEIAAYEFDARSGCITKLNKAGFSLRLTVTKAGNAQYNDKTQYFDITIEKGTIASEISIEGLSEGENPVFGKQYKLQISGHGIISGLIKLNNAGTGTASGSVFNEGKIGTISISDRGASGTLVIKITQEETIFYNAYSNEFIVTFEKADGTQAPDYELPSGLTVCVNHVSRDVSLPVGWAWDASTVPFTDAKAYTVTATFTPEGNNYDPTTQELTVTATAHVWTENVHADYLEKPATTESAAVYRKSCSVCGDIHPTETFTDGYPLRTVSFDAGGGTGSVPVSATVEHGSQYILPEKPEDLVRAGYTFAGWKATTYHDVWQPGESVTVNDNLTMVAQWTLAAPVITGEPQDIVKEYDGESSYATVTVEAVPGLSLSYQWERKSASGGEWETWSGITAHEMGARDVAASKYIYRCLVTVRDGEQSESVYTREVSVDITKGAQPEFTMSSTEFTYTDGLTINLYDLISGGCYGNYRSVTITDKDKVEFSFTDGSLNSECIIRNITKAGGSFKVTVTDTGNDNYKLYSQTFTVTLHKGARTIEILSTIDNPVFGDKCWLSVDGIPDTLVKYEIVEGGGTATGQITEFRKLTLNRRGAAGTITVKATVASNDLYLEATATRPFTFGKAKGLPLTFDTSDFTYNGGFLRLDQRGGGGYTYTLDPDESEYAEFFGSSGYSVWIKKAGATIHVTMTREESENYLESSETFAINILKGMRTLSVADCNDLTFGETRWIKVEGVKSYDELTFAIKEGGGTATGTITELGYLTITDRGIHGTITVIVGAPENDLYLASEPVEKQFTFAKASYEDAPEWAGNMPEQYYTVCTGKTLEDVELPAYWTWESGQTLSSTVGSYDMTAIFTPAEPNNYDGTEGTINVTVAAHTGGNATCMEKATCTRCGEQYGEFGDHDYGEAWVSNGNGTHSHVCTLNSEHKSESQNCSGGTATCTSKAACQHCSAEYGEVDSVNHNYSEDWTADGENGHYHVCQNDNSHHSETEPHTGGTATCSAKAVCSVCEEPYGDFADHDYGEAWESDASGHWHICTVGGEAGTVSAHSPDRDAPTETEPVKCTDCGYIIAPATGHVTHTPDEVWHSDGEKHWHKCTGCEEKLNIATHSGGTATCEQKAQCEICGTRYGDLAAHTYGAWQQHDASQHKRICSVNDSHIEYANHNWNAGEITTSPTHTTPGTKTITCVDCGQTRTESVPALTEHTYNQEVAEAKYLKSEATCTSPAVYFKSCICGEKGTETFTYGNALGHNYEFTQTVAPNLEAQTDGYDLYTCSHDPSHTEQRNIVEWETLIPKVTVTVSGGSIEGHSGNTATVNKDGSVTVIAASPEEGKVFKGWSDGTEIISTDTTYAFTATADLTLTAIYEDAIVTPPDDDKPGLSGGAIAGIAVGGTAAAALGGFSIFWFGIKKRRFSDLFKRKK